MGSLAPRSRKGFMVLMNVPMPKSGRCMFCKRTVPIKAKVISCDHAPPTGFACAECTRQRFLPTDGSPEPDFFRKS